MIVGETRGGFIVNLFKLFMVLGRGLVFGNFIVVYGERGRDGF